MLWQERGVSGFRLSARAAWAWAGAVCSLALACGGGAATTAGSKSPEDAAPSSAEATEGEAATTEATSEQDTGPIRVPTECAKETGEGVCLPSARFVQKLCNDVYADVALTMFSPDTPWTRAYLTGKTEAWNASGGASVSGELAFDEEVLILRYRGVKKGGMQVSGEGANYDALRWNGSCVSLSGREVTFKVPPKKLSSRVEWKWLGESMREALRADSTVKESYFARRRECKGVSLGVVSRKCEQLDKKLVEVIVQYVRDGGTLGTPEFP